MQVIQTIRREPFFSEIIALEGRDFEFVFEWNQRDGWYLGLNDSEGNVIFSPRKLVIGWDLLRSVRWSEEAPQGGLFAVERAATGVKPGFLDLATSFEADDGRVVLVYITEAERETFSG